MRFSGPALRKEIVSLLIVIGLVTVCRSSLADHYYIPSSSMEYTLLPGDRVIVDKTAYGLRIPLTRLDLFAAAQPERGDIVVFDSPTDGTRLIKRVAALGGDQVTLRDGRLRINGAALADSPAADAAEIFGEHLASLNLGAGGGPDIDAFIVPDGEVLVLGDKRGDSHDGRYFGTIAEDELFGRAVAIYYRRGDGFVWRDL